MHEVDVSHDQKNMHKIAVRNDHPEAIEKTAEAKTDDIKTLIVNSKDYIDTVAGSRSKFITRQARLKKVRYGIRKPTTFPFPGASNLSVPIIDKTLRQTNPTFVSMIHGAGDLVKFKASPNPQNVMQNDHIADLNKYYFNDMVKRRMTKTLKKLILLVDKLNDEGRATVKVTYEYTSEGMSYKVDLNEAPENIKVFLNNNYEELKRRSPEGDAVLAYMFQAMLKAKGCTINIENADDFKEINRNIDIFLKDFETDLTFKFIQVKKKAPMMTVCKYQDIIVHGAVNDIQEAHFIAHQMCFTKTQLEQFASNGSLDADVIDAILNKDKPSEGDTSGSSVKAPYGVNQEMDEVTAKLSGSSHTDDHTGLYDVYECYLYADPDKTGLLKRCILTFSPEYMEKPLRFTVLHYDDGKWPFVSYEREVTDAGFLAPRGLTLMGDQIQAAINIQHNQKINAQTILNAPMFWYNKELVDWQTNVKFIPGQGIPVKGPNAFGQVVTGNQRLQHSVEEERNLRSFWEMYISTPDSVSSDPTSSKKTATEVIKTDSLSKQVFSLDITLFLENTKELYEMLWAREMQFGDAERWLAVTGEENPVQWKKQYGLQDMDIYPVPSLSSVTNQGQIGHLNYMLNLAKDPMYGPMLFPYKILKDATSAVFPEKNVEYVRGYDEWKAAVQQQGQQNAANQKDIMQRQDKLDLREHQQKLEEIEAKASADLKTSIMKSQVTDMMRKFEGKKDGSEKKAS